MEKLKVIKAVVKFELSNVQPIEPKEILIPLSAVSALIPAGENKYDVVFGDTAVKQVFYYAKVKSITATIPANQIEFL